jgi:hypothetical protein
MPQRKKNIKNRSGFLQGSCIKGDKTISVSLLPDTDYQSAA